MKGRFDSVLICHVSPELDSVSYPPVLIWSTTFYAITLQPGSVTAPTYAVGLRFGIAATLLLVWLAIRVEPITRRTSFGGTLGVFGVALKSKEVWLPVFWFA